MSIEKINKQNNVIKVLIVEDSAVKSALLRQILNSDPEIKVINTVNSGEQALRVLNQIKPDIITMDINLPGMDGFETTEKILNTYPIPIIIISSLRSEKNRSTLLETMQKAGSLYFMDSPPSPWSPDYKKASEKIIRMIKLLSATLMITRHKSHTKIIPDTLITASSQTNTPCIPAFSKKQNVRLIAIGVSTGGPQTLVEILSNLPYDYPIPILVVQHIGIGFDTTLVQYLDTNCKLNVKIPINNELAQAGKIYIAPAGQSMTINSNNRIIISKPNLSLLLNPSVSELFKSVAENFGSSAVGILLTGMGRDGAEELKLIRDTGALTIAQNKESCVVFGMPGEAVRLGAASEILSTKKIAETLITLGEQ